MVGGVLQKDIVVSVVGRRGGGGGRCDGPPSLAGGGLRGVVVRGPVRRVIRLLRRRRCHRRLLPAVHRFSVVGGFAVCPLQRHVG